MFYDPSKILILKLDKDGIEKENYKHICPIKLDSQAGPFKLWQIEYRFY